MEVAQAVATIGVAIVGYVYSSEQKKAECYRARRELITEAASQVDMEFAMSVFKDRIFGQYLISEADYSQILSEHIKFPREAWQRKCRSQLMVFLETIRPVCHILGNADGDLALEGHTDPILFKFRLSMLALGDFWSPQKGLKSCCNDDHRSFIRGMYGDDHEWELLCTSLSRIGMKGRLDNPSEYFVENLPPTPA